MKNWRWRLAVSVITIFSMVMAGLQGASAQADSTSGMLSRDVDETAAFDEVGAHSEVDVASDGNAVEFRVIDNGLDASVVTQLRADGLLTVEVQGLSEGQYFSEKYDVEEFTVTDDSAGEFTAVLEGRTSAQTISINSDKASTQAVPVIMVLGVLARLGLRVAIKRFGKTQIKKAAKSYLLKQNANKWRHIMEPKHCWGKVGARSREQVAEIMARAMVDGQHSNYKGDKQARWKYRGRMITVTYHGESGRISDGWVDKVGGKC